jgi:dihydroflavonol-4-reductase
VRPLVLGAAGFLGVNLVDALRAAGVEPRCGRRARTNVLPLRSRGCQLVPADLDDFDGLSFAMDGCDVVFHAAAHYPRHSLDRDAAFATGLGQLERVLRAASRVGVRRIVFVSSSATVAPSPDGPSDERHVYRSSPGLGVYHDLKWAMEQVALSDPRVVVACPSACIGPWDLRVGTSALLVALARGLDPPHPEGVVSLVDAADVGSALVQLGGMAAPPRRVILAGSNHGLQGLLEALAGRYGVAAPSAPLSAAAALALADAEERRSVAEGGRPALSREIADLVVHGVPLDAGLAARALGIAFSPLSDTLDRFDAWARRMRLIPDRPVAVEVSP